jgi:hypothetical protein
VGTKLGQREENQNQGQNNKSIREKTMKKAIIVSGILALTLSGCAGKNYGILPPSADGEGSAGEVSAELDSEKSLDPGIDSTANSGSDGNSEQVAEATAETTAYSTQELADTVGASGNLPIYKVYSYQRTSGYHGEKSLPEDYNGALPYQIFSMHNEEILVTEEYKDEYPELYTTLMDKAKENQSHYQDDYGRQNAEALEVFENCLDNGYFDEFRSFQDARYLTVARADSNILSVMELDYLDMMGAHGQYAQGGETYDVKTGKELSLPDIVVCDDDKFREVVKEALVDSVEDDYYWLISLDDALKNYKMATDSPSDYSYNWYMDYEGLKVVFAPYEIGSYAEGIFTADISYDKYADIFENKYISDLPTSYVTCANVEVGDITFAGKDEHYKLTYDTEDGEYGTKVTLESGDKSAASDADLWVNCYGIKSYRAVTKTGKEYIYVELPYFAAGNPWAVFDVTDGNLSCQGNFFTVQGALDYKDDQDKDFAGYPCFTYPDRFMMGLPGYGFGSYGYFPEYKIGQDGMPQQLSETGAIGLGSHEAKLLVDMEFAIVDDDGNIVSEKEMIPSGTTFGLIRANDGSIADCRIDDGRIVRVEVDDGQKVNGQNMSDVFDNLVYGDF